MVLAGGAWICYYQFIDTLLLSEIVEESGHPVENSIASVFDFDTGLSRHDVKQLKQKCGYWKSRLDDVNDIDDLNEYDQEMGKLLVDMDKDPQMKKVGELIKVKGALVVELVLEVF